MKQLLKHVYRQLSLLLNTRHLHIVKSLAYLNRRSKISLERLDFVRLSCLELIAHEISEKNTPGNVAELGVYQGDFAASINLAFPDKKLYLFDTFEGFSFIDKHTELKNAFSSASQDFSNTSTDLVLSKMTFRNQCSIQKGYFPDTTNGVEDHFCFVSIDTDLYEPIYAGLQYFFPRLSRGGYIMVHDFNNDEYKGARQAVVKFCTEHNIGYVPIADIGGSVIITK